MNNKKIYLDDDQGPAADLQRLLSVEWVLSECWVSVEWVLSECRVVVEWVCVRENYQIEIDLAVKLFNLGT